MFNKILLASIGGAEEKFEDLFCRLKITVGEGDDGVGYKESSFGACEVLEGDTTVYSLYVDSYGATTLEATMTTDEFDTGMLVVNVTTSLKKKYSGFGSFGSGVGEMLFFGDLFDGISVGQDCIIEIYLKSA